MAAVFHLEFVPDADIYKTANYLRTMGMIATVSDDSRDRIVIETDSYNKTLEQLTEIVPKLPDIYKFSWNDGPSETLLYEAPQTRKFISDTELVESLKVVANSDEKTRITVVLREDKNTIIRYQNVVRKIENMGFRVTFADGFRDAGWMQFPAIDIEIPNNVASFKEAIWKISEVPEVSRFLYSLRRTPNINEHAVIFERGINLEEQLSKILASGIEIYKLDKTLNKIFLHFPESEAQNKNKIEQLKAFKGVVAVKNLHENSSQFSTPEYAKNVKTIWVDVPVSILSGKWSRSDYSQELTALAKKEVERLQSKGMIVLHYGLYSEIGEVLLPEVVFTYTNSDSPRAEEILSEYKIARGEKKPAPKKRKPAMTNTCAQLF